MCCLKPFLDLDVFPQMSQEWLMLVRWFASMCLFKSVPSPSFPQTLQMNDGTLFPFVLVRKFPLESIIDLICWSSSIDSSLATVFTTETVLCAWLSNGTFESVITWLFRCSIFCCCWNSLTGRFFASLSLVSPSPVRPFNFRSSAMARKVSKLSW